MTLPASAPWCGHHPTDIPDLLGETSGWWVCGGWAVDLWAGRQTRPHGDTDIGCYRDEVCALLTHIRDWRIYEAREGDLTLLESPERIRSEVNSLWCHRPGAREWDLQIMLEVRRNGRWLYRRDSRVSRPHSAICSLTEPGLPTLLPEIQLLYKAAKPRARDHADWALLAPILTPSAVAWLDEALSVAHPQADWLEQLRG